MLIKTIYLPFLAFIFVIQLVSCNETKDKNSPNKQYYDLKTLINKQIRILNKAQPIVVKEITTAQGTETKETKQLDWEKELLFFKNSNINLPALRGAYLSEQTDSSFTYKLKPTLKSNIKYISVVFDKKKQLKSAKIILEENNMIYHSVKKLSINCLNNQIEKYQITGFQKFILGDKNWFDIKGKLKKNPLTEIQ